MIKNYFKTAFRNFWKNKAFSFINILGLSLGIACSLLIFLWVQDERSVDSFHTNEKNLYAVYERVFSNGKTDGGYYTPGLLPDELKRKIPEIQEASGFNADQLQTFQVGEKIDNLVGADAGEDFFTMFSYSLLQGNAASALNDPSSIAISEKMANIFFGSAQAAIGKAIRCNNRDELMITAVFKNLPANTSNKFDFVLNWKYLLKNVDWLNTWEWSHPGTFILLRPDADEAAVQIKIKNFLDDYNKTQNAGYHIKLGLQPFGDMYLHSTFENGYPDTGPIQYVRLFTLVAIFILFIACINFMNLATAQSIKRAKEVGVRKVTGASRGALIRQFLGEAILLVLFSIPIAIAITTFLLPVFNDLTGKQIVIPFTSISFWLELSGLLFFTGFIAGSYPALFLSSLKPVKVLKGTLKFNTGATLFRRGLVVFQFILSIVLIIGTIVVSKQVNYIQTKNLGFDKGNLIYIPVEGELAANYSVFKQDAAQLPAIKSVTRISSAPIRIANHSFGLDWQGKDVNTKAVTIHAAIGYDFLETMNVKLLQGRGFSQAFPADTSGFIINETALKLIGYKNPVGKPLSLFPNQQKDKIIGVVQDFNFNSLHEPVQPLVMWFGENIDWGFILVRSTPGNTKQAITGLEKICKQLNPEFPFTYYFADDEYQKLYDSEEMVGKLSNYFAVLAIFISCLGLLGLSIFTTEQRMKEFGIRKVLGASTASLFNLLSREFLWLVFIALIIAAPIAWIVMDKWLEDYAYRINISWWIFLFAGLLAILIALITVSFQAIKAAMANPVKSLRTE